MLHVSVRGMRSNNGILQSGDHPCNLPSALPLVGVFCGTYHDVRSGVPCKFDVSVRQGDWGYNWRHLPMGWTRVRYAAEDWLTSGISWWRGGFTSSNFWFTGGQGQF